MRLRTLALGPLCLSLSFTSGLLADSAPQVGGPPKVLQIYREEVKPGKMAAHQKMEANWPRLFAKANFPSNYLAIESITGPNEAWFLSGYGSFADWGKDTEVLEKNPALKAELERLGAQDAELLSGVRSIVAFLREDMSYLSNTINVTKDRFFRITTIRARPGHEADFKDAAKLVRDAYEKSKTEIPWAVYQVSAGMPGPTYLIFTPMKSLADADAGLARMKTIQDAEGEEGQKAISKHASDGYSSLESNLFAFSPKMSYPSKEFIAADPAYWAPKPAASAKSAPPAKKEGQKKEAEKPAEKK